MEIISRSSWDEAFFTDHIAFKHGIHKDILTSFPETLEDYARFFAPSSPFASDIGWRAFRVVRSGQIVAQAILCWRKGTDSGNVGFIDWLNEPEAAKLLIDEVTAAAKSEGLRSLKTPVDVNFFVKYRIRLPNGGPPLYGEPIYPDYYHELFRHTGFLVTGQWDTYRVRRWAGMKDFFLKRRRLSKVHGKGHTGVKEKAPKTKVRCVRLKDWENELKIIHDLFSRAYGHMPEFEPTSFEQFKVVYDDFKYIINPLYSYIVELQGKPVGFCINYVDPLPILAKLKGKKLATWQKALVLLRLRLNNGTYMITHVGKVPGPNGEEIKGVQIQVSRWITATSWYMRRFVVTFQNINSPSRRTWNPDVWEPHASYVLYGKDL